VLQAVDLLEALGHRPRVERRLGLPESDLVALIGEPPVSPDLFTQLLL
jgi:hypothetical protein